jgi:hypothetical protein
MKHELYGRLVISKDVDNMILDYNEFTHEITITEVKIMERSIYDALARLGTVEILKEDSEVRERFNSLVAHIRTGSDEMNGLVDNMVEDSQSFVVEVLAAKEDAEFILDYFIKTGMEIIEKLTAKEHPADASARAIDSMASRIIRKAKEKDIL